MINCHIASKAYIVTAFSMKNAGNFQQQLTEFVILLLYILEE